MSKHKKALEELADNPQLLGINNAREIILEKPIYRHYGNNKICEPDLIISTRDYKNYLVEYKCNDSENQRRKARKQLMIASEALKNMKIPIHHMLYVYGHFTVEEYQEGFWWMHLF